ncbi:Hypp196 [Branchiostoma lanceolatum]|uniref:Hypp196 protein n=1 Tax=Branchiostoma lanceolatum TaxID=7740 RepID=A0A8J9VAY7_BRALA|nr:Hypp196 [Branchiostoma lanceolatum]
MDRRKLAPRAVEVLTHPRNQVAERRLQLDLRKLDLHAARAANKIKNEISLLRATVPSSDGSGMRKRSIHEFPHLQGAMFAHDGEMKRPVSRQTRNTIYRASVELVRPPSIYDSADKDGVPVIQVEDEKEEKENEEKDNDSDSDTMSEDLPMVPFQTQITLPKFHVLIQALVNKSRAAGGRLHQALRPEKNARFKAIARAALNKARLEKKAEIDQENMNDGIADCSSSTTADEASTKENKDLKYDLSYQRQNSASRARKVAPGKQSSTKDKDMPTGQSMASCGKEEKRMVCPPPGMSARSKSAPNLKLSPENLEANSKMYSKRVLTTNEFLNSLAPNTQPWRTQSALANRRHPSGSFDSTSAAVGTRATKSAGVFRSLGTYMYGENYYPASSISRTGHPSERFPVYNAWQIKKAQPEKPRVPIWKRKSVRDNCSACRNKLRQERSVELAKAFRSTFEAPAEGSRGPSAVSPGGSRANSAVPLGRSRAASVMSPGGYRRASVVSPAGLRGITLESPGGFRSASALEPRGDGKVEAETVRVRSVSAAAEDPSGGGAGSPQPTSGEPHPPPDKPAPKKVKNDLLNPDKLEEFRRQLEKNRQMHTANTMAVNVAFFGLKA